MSDFVVTWTETIVIKRKALVSVETEAEAIQVIKDGDRTKSEKLISVNIRPCHNCKATSE